MAQQVQVNAPARQSLTELWGNAGIGSPVANPTVPNVTGPTEADLAALIAQAGQPAPQQGQQPDLLSLLGPALGMATGGPTGAIGSFLGQKVMGGPTLQSLIGGGMTGLAGGIKTAESNPYRKGLMKYLAPLAGGFGAARASDSASAEAARKDEHEAFRDRILMADLIRKGNRDKSTDERYRDTSTRLWEKMNRDGAGGDASLGDQIKLALQLREDGVEGADAFLEELIPQYFGGEDMGLSLDPKDWTSRMIAETQENPYPIKTLEQRANVPDGVHYRLPDGTGGIKGGEQAGEAEDEVGFWDRLVPPEKDSNALARMAKAVLPEEDLYSLLMSTGTNLRNMGGFSDPAMATPRGMQPTISGTYADALKRRAQASAAQPQPSLQAILGR